MYKVIFCVIKQDICLRALSSLDHHCSSEAALEEYSSNYLQHRDGCWWCKCFPARGQKFKLLRKCSPSRRSPPTSSNTLAILMQQIDQLVVRDIHLLFVPQISVVHLYCVKNRSIIPLSNKWKLLFLVQFANTMLIAH